MGLKGDFYVDFAVAVFLFMIAFTSVFSYISSEYSYRQDYERNEAQKMEIDQVIRNLSGAEVEKRLVIASGFSQNEFVNLSGLDTDLVLDEAGEPVCFNKGLEGFVANISGESVFSVFSTKERLSGRANYCALGSFANRLDELVSSPIYLQVLFEQPAETQGEYCEIRQLSRLSDSGFEKAPVKICV